MSLALELSLPDRSHRASLGGSTVALTLNCAALLAIAVFLRSWQLGNIPGVNGDEAWSGVQAERVLQGRAIDWITPTGNPINVFFLIPVVALHSVAEPSFLLLRIVPLVSGLIALAANYFLCRRAFDVRTAIVSTLILALMPINIAYSRFAWDASQSLLATVLVLYLPLLRCRGSREYRLSVAAAFALVAAIIVHPTNVFALPLVVATMLYGRRKEWIARLQNTAIPATTLTLVAITAVVGSGFYLAWRWLPTVVNRLHGPRELGEFAANYLQLLSGTSIFEFISSGPPANDGLWPDGVSAVSDLAFGVLAIAGLWGLYRRLTFQSAELDAAVVVGWITMLAGFFVVAGPAAIAPHLERYGICLIAPAALTLARGLTWWIKPFQWHARSYACVLCIAAWLWPASFYLEYFRCFETTGGSSHLTFRTAAIEPKLAAFRYIREHHTDGQPATIVCREWWNYWPLAYLACGEEEFRVLTEKEWRDLPLIEQQRSSDRTWWIEFAGAPSAGDVERDSAEGGINPRSQKICDYAGRPVLEVIGPPEKLSRNY